VILGAGLDTFAYRNPFGESTCVSSKWIILPAQAWKRDLLERADITIPASLTYVPVNFERQAVADELSNARLEDG